MSPGTTTPPSGELHRYKTADGFVFLVPFGWAGDDRVSRCKGRQKGGSCDQVVLWCTTRSGKKAPVNVDGSVHFGTCPDREAFHA